MDTRVRLLLAPVVALLVLSGLAGLAWVEPAPVALSAGHASADAGFPETGGAVEEPSVVPETTTTTTTTTAAPAPRQPRKPAVVADKPYGDYPAGTVISGPVAITGVVRDVSNNPFAHACVTVWANGHPDGQPVFDGRTGADGRFETGFDLESVADWTYIRVMDCSPAMPGFARQHISLMTEPAKDYDVPVTVQPGSALRGRLFNTAGAPVPGVCVIVSMNPISSFGVVTDANGAWTLSGLPQGRFGLAARSPESGACALAKGTDYPTSHLVAPDKSVSYTAVGDISAPGVFEGYELFLRS